MYIGGSKVAGCQSLKYNKNIFKNMIFTNVSVLAVGQQYYSMYCTILLNVITHYCIAVHNIIGICKHSFKKIIVKVALNWTNNNDHDQLGCWFSDLDIKEQHFGFKIIILKQQLNLVLVNFWGSKKNSLTSDTLLSI